MSLTKRLQAYLEKLYYVPFDIQLQPAGKEPQLLIQPVGSHQSLFNILMQYQNKIRLSMELKPQKFSANMVRGMGKATPEQKTAFTSFCKLMDDDGAKIVLRINNEKADPLDWENWPTDWETLTFRVTIIPIYYSAEEQPDYDATSLKWGALMTGGILSLLDVVPQKIPEEIPNDDSIPAEGYKEGNRVRVLTNKYERNRINRALCLKKYGYSCQICGFDFEDVYGDIGSGFIHVHHKIPVSEMGPDYIVNPLEDLIPVCPNCHAMLHAKTPPLTPEELREMIKK